MTGSRQAGVAWAETQIGKPYSETLDGGTGPNYWDCSGLVQGMARSQGVAIERTTSQQWPELQHVQASQLLAGDLIYFHVPADGGAVPQHVGIWVGPGRMLEAPHTGAFVRYAAIPNTPGESIWGYARIPWPGTPVNPAPLPKPSPTYPLNLTELLTMNCLDPTTGGTWIVDPTDGHVETWNGAPYLGALNNPTPDADGWKEVGFIAGITPQKDASGKWGYAIIVRHNAAFGPSGQWYSPYFFPRGNQ